MNLPSKNLLLISTVALLIVTPALFLLNFLHAGFPAAMACYCLILISLAVVLRTINITLRKISLEVLLYIPVVYLLVTPNVVLSEAITTEGYEYFINEMLYTYIYLTAAALLLLIFALAFYAKEKGLDTGKLKSNLFSILTLALLVRLYWLIVIETRHLAEFSARLPHLHVEYVVLGGIPLFAVILILTLRKNVLGYVLGAIAGFPHMALVAYQFLTRFSRTAELGGATAQGPAFPTNAIAVFFSSLAIFLFCLKGIMNNGPKLTKTERRKIGLRSVYIQAVMAMMFLQLTQIARGFTNLTTLSKATGHPVGVLTLVVGGLLTIAMVMGVLRIKWGLVLGIIAGVWMIFQPVMVGAIGVQLGQSVTWWHVLLKVALALLLIYFCALAWKRVFHDDESKGDIQK